VVPTQPVQIETISKTLSYESGSDVVIGTIIAATWTALEAPISGTFELLAMSWRLLTYARPHRGPSQSQATKSPPNADKRGMHIQPYTLLCECAVHYECLRARQPRSMRRIRKALDAFHRRLLWSLSITDQWIHRQLRDVCVSCFPIYRRHNATAGRWCLRSLQETYRSATCQGTQTRSQRQRSRRAGVRVFYSWRRILRISDARTFERL
jgi:hypothetical protein